MSNEKSCELIQVPVTIETENWRAVAKRAAEENDPDKLLRLVHDLCRILEEHDSLGAAHHTNS